MRLEELSGHKVQLPVEVRETPTLRDAAIYAREVRKNALKLSALLDLLGEEVARERLSIALAAFADATDAIDNAKTCPGFVRASDAPLAPQGVLL